jgi:hypothetical protein
MLEVQAESLRLQRLLVERLLGAPDVDAPVQTTLPASESTAPAVTAPVPPALVPPAPVPPPSTPTPPPRPPPAADDTRSRGARYYQPRPSPAAPAVKPEELELMRRLQQMREASGLILQFGPYKGTTLAQVAIAHPEYIRELLVSARRPEVRAAAGRLVEALDAAAEHTRKSPRGAARRGHAS